MQRLLKATSPLTIAGVPEGYDALILADGARASFADGHRTLLHIARDDLRLSALENSISFFAPDIEIISFPAWDCLPYDRVGPHGDILAKRMTALSRLASITAKKPRLILTTVNAALQRVPPNSMIDKTNFIARIGDEVDIPKLTDFLITNGYSRASQVMERGEFAVRGGLIDIFAPGTVEPVRMDFFGDELDTIRRFDPLTQRSTGKVKSIHLRAVSEFALDDESIKRFRRGYNASFGPAKSDDPLYGAISEGRRLQGAEHWLPLFHDEMATLFDYTGDCLLTLDQNVSEAVSERFTAISDYYTARLDTLESEKAVKLAGTYKPIKPETLYLTEEEWTLTQASLNACQLSHFQEPESAHVINNDAKVGRDFGPERNQKDINVYDALYNHVKDLHKAGMRIIFASYSEGSRERLKGVLADHKIRPLELSDSWEDVRKTDSRVISLAVVPLEKGFVTSDIAVITEQDILGDRLVRKSRRAKRADNFLKEASTLSAGDFVVHASHGIGRFEGLETIKALGAAHDCLLLTYHGGDKLYVPVENIEILSRFGSQDAHANLDKLGGVAWQAKKAKLKERIRDMADKLIKLAAARALRRGEKITPPDGSYAEFCARFPFQETDDQLRSIRDVINDLGSGNPMDRLICGDVGFGKTEVALRAAFITAMSGRQVTLIAPTTLLVRQHTKTFTERFKGLPIRIGQLSRLVSQKNIKATKDEMEKGTVDIVIGTHALLAKDIKFRDLGLLIIDEEQHFGVGHKEKLKALKSNVHVLTLTATPIPRTLQLSMTGLRDLSLIATPPVDRLAIRTFVLPFDPVVVREALLREHYRGGQSFYICPRVADLQDAADFLKEYVPEVKFIMAHGQMTPSTIEDVMTAFYEGRYDVLLSTTIVESGIDIPSANTMIIHRADMFGLAQLYQLRGRVGRSKVRAYAYMTVPPNRILSEGANKRLQVLQTLDTLGAGFTLASHDMDIRGAGNLLGEEQSGHIREVGAELYQQMLEEAVAEAKAADFGEEAADTGWSPTINVGATVMIPEKYVPDLNQRMALYRRLAELDTREEIDGFAAEMIDRFGALPSAVKQLTAVMIIKSYCKKAGIEKIDAGPRGMTISFRNDRFENPAGLIAFISNQKTPAKLKPDHKLVYRASMDKIGIRLRTVATVARNLAKMAVSS